MLVNGKRFTSIWTESGAIKIIDQRRLPYLFEVEEIRCFDEMVSAIRDMHVRGAPLIGVAAAYGMHLAVKEAKDEQDLTRLSAILRNARPTAIDLTWAVDIQLKKISQLNAFAEKAKTAFSNAELLRKESIQRCRQIGEHGYLMLKEIAKKKGSVNILTHCNAGWLACVDYGTATAPIYVAAEKGMKLHVWVDETRPRNQGMLTAWELGEEGIPHTIIPDNTGGHLMQVGKVDIVIVGSDRVTANGDVTNKIGTYLKALAAKDNGIPFYAAMPTSTVDWSMKHGSEVPIELRSEDEIHYVHGLNSESKLVRIKLTPDKSRAENYGFDVTPARLVTGLITEKGISKPGDINLI